MRYYHPKSSKTPRNVFMQVKYKLKNYESLKAERMNILYASPVPSDGMPRGTERTDETARKAERLAAIDTELCAIEQTVSETRGLYSKRVYEEFDPVQAYWNYDYFNYMHRRKNKEDEGPSVRTWQRYKDSFSHRIAEKLKLL